ncbi:L-fucose mutarotase type 2 [Vibrio variabilis]|uniref:L-fucose mutarotase type 2 n=1 Tax=Vibrio variabilis TaxID=990271 RepID=A0ABQ0JER9_9VIBR|nr:L-fucose mutarotase type 2 [Vibrio variabilis]
MRVGSVIEIKPEKISEYNQLHANQWPEVTTALTQARLHNYSIYLRQLPDGKHYLFSYYEYRGTDYQSDMDTLAKNPKIQQWWDICKPMHLPFEDRAEHEWWAEMEEVFHQD